MIKAGVQEAAGAAGALHLSEVIIQRPPPHAAALKSYTDTRVFEAHGQDPLVDLMELHQLQEVDEQRQAVIHGVVLPATVFALRTRTKAVGTHGHFQRNQGRDWTRN